MFFQSHPLTSDVRYGAWGQSGCFGSHFWSRLFPSELVVDPSWFPIGDLFGTSLEDHWHPMMAGFVREMKPASMKWLLTKLCLIICISSLRN